MKRALLVLSILVVLVGCALVFLFPGQRTGIALTLGTGLGMPALQARVTALEVEAFEGGVLDATERQLLVDLYRTMATGGRLSGVMSQAGRMMDHYLDGTGRPYALDAEIFLSSRRVRQQMTTLRARITRQGCESSTGHSSERFYMPDSQDLDSHFGLYWGTLEVTSAENSDGHCALTWTAEVPWVWPTFAELTRPDGERRREVSRIPNLKSLIAGRQHALQIDNGLGGHLVALRLAKPFVAQAIWQEVWTP